MKNTLFRRSLDNITVVIISFKNLKRKLFKNKKSLINNNQDYSPSKLLSFGGLEAFKNKRKEIDLKFSKINELSFGGKNSIDNIRKSHDFFYSNSIKR